MGMAVHSSTLCIFIRREEIRCSIQYFPTRAREESMRYWIVGILVACEAAILCGTLALSFELARDLQRSEPVGRFVRAIEAAPDVAWRIRITLRRRSG
jgi:predicted outer membrane lipoprotein